MSRRKNISVNQLVEQAKCLDKSGHTSKALQTIYNFVERIITEPLCTSQVYGSKALDTLCQNIGEYNLQRLPPVQIEPSTDLPSYVYIVTKIQKSGGHTRVIEDFISARPKAKHIILATGLAGPSDQHYLLDGLGKQIAISFEQADGNYQQRLTWLQQHLLTINAKKVYLFNHHQDSVAVAAIQPVMNLDAYFCHHGDHHLCLGVYLEHLTHVDLHPMGYNCCRDDLAIDNSYIPLTCADKGDRPKALPFCPSGMVTTCTAGRSNKIELPYFVSYLDMVPKILKQTGGRHVHIGKLSPWALWRIHWGLKRYSIPKQNFIYRPWVPSVWEALHSYKVDLYIASFPYGGALTLVEAMGAGVPVALHRHMFSKILGCIELAYPGAFCWSLPDELLVHCSSLNPERLSKESLTARQHYLSFHTGEQLREILDGNLKAEPVAVELYGERSAQPDEWAIWLSNQLTITGVLSRTAYRLAKRLQRLF